jgi:uncharacterized membrane protein
MFCRLAMIFLYLLKYNMKEAVHKAKIRIKKGVFMQGLQWLKVYVIGYGSFILLDILWLGYLMRNFYIKNMANYLQIENGNLVVNWPVALSVWALLVFGLLLFVLPKAAGASLATQFIWGAVYGFIVYGVYEGTNFAMFAQWPMELVMADLLWGMFINGVVACVMRYFV